MTGPVALCSECASEAATLRAKVEELQGRLDFLEDPNDPGSLVHELQAAEARATSAETELADFKRGAAMEISKETVRAREAEDQRDRAVEALRFYGGPTNWKSKADDDGFVSNDVARDRGKRAREALNAIDHQLGPGESRRASTSETADGATEALDRARVLLGQAFDLVTRFRGRKAMAVLTDVLGEIDAARGALPERAIEGEGDPR